MSGSDQKNSSDSNNCHSSEEKDPLAEVVAAMAGLSVSGRRCPPVGGTSKKYHKKCTKVTLSTLPWAVSGKSTNAKVKTLKRRWDNVFSEDKIRSTSPYIKRSKIKTKVLGKTKGERTRMYFVYNREEPEPNIPQEQENIECKKTETTKEAENKEKAKPRRGGVIHRSENNCCPVLPSSASEPQSLRDLQMEDIKAVGQTFCPGSYSYWIWGFMPPLPICILWPKLTAAK
ncbi:uncharacterized protein LOC122975087 [Thunnus albacares]|uniref:uncharacterized protein LOC122975087 n=1 Tax=Thunnus albacares TaxID=8236 RepID=UPI001CF69F03|nr:uncharacterized protein LOC122975087 [Thunnus albacares]